MATVYGIDLGTTYSCIAKCDEHQHISSICPPNGLQGGTTLPSVVCFEEETGKPFVGSPAKNALGRRGMPERSISFFKRFMGKEWYPNKIIVGREKRDISPVEGAACILHDLLEAANDKEKAAGNAPSHKAVITIPAGFNSRQRMCTKIAAELAGIEVLGLVHEPTAAAISYNIKNGETILVFDLGGGTLDVSIVKNNRGKYEVLASAGDYDTLGKYIGGMDWDRLLMDWAIDEAKAQNGYKKGTISDKAQEEAQLLLRAEECKMALSSQASADFSFPDFSSVKIKQSDFAKLSSNLIDDCMRVVKATIDKADQKFGKIKIDRCVMAGASSNMPMIKTNLSRVLAGRIANGRQESEWLYLVNPHRAIAEGAARYAYMLEHKLATDDGIGVLEESRFSYGTSISIRSKGVVGEQKYIRNLIKASDPMIFDSKIFKFNPTYDGQKDIDVDIYEDTSIEERIPLTDDIERINSGGEKYVFDSKTKVTTKTIIEFIVSRDKDGIISIKVTCSGHPSKHYTISTAPVSGSTRLQIKHSIELMDVIIDEECK